MVAGKQRMVVVGDLHGSLADLVTIFDKAGSAPLTCVPLLCASPVCFASVPHLGASFFPVFFSYSSTLIPICSLSTCQQFTEGGSQRTAGFPSEQNRYVFDGDFVDRGKCGMEVLAILLAYQVTCTNCVASIGLSGTVSSHYFTV